ncbi:unnamed protein product [Rotaria sp. Silwood2]|nr:unnamed protein product [Rotaria sp. Silwood2]
MTINRAIFESISNEFLLELFELFNSIDLFRAFHDLNGRFNSLLFIIYFQNYPIDFHSIIEADFDIFCQTYFSSIVNRTIYLRLSDDDDTPYQCTQFLPADLTLDSKTKLTCLSEMHFPSDSVRNVGYSLPIFDDAMLYNIQLINIERLSFQLSIDDRFLSIIPDFESLHSLCVTVPTIIGQSQLQALLDNASRLYSLSFES